MNNFEKITRVEVIDATGRILVINNSFIRLMLQDDVRTLKIFIPEDINVECKYKSNENK